MDLAEVWCRDALYTAEVGGFSCAYQYTGERLAINTAGGSKLPRGARGGAVARRVSGGVEW